MLQENIRKRTMQLYEYQSKVLLQRFQIPFQPYYFISKETDITSTIQTCAIEEALIEPQSLTTKERYEAHSSQEIVEIIQTLWAQEHRLFDTILLTTPIPSFTMPYTISINLQSELWITIDPPEGRSHKENIAEHTLHRFQLDRLIHNMKIPEKYEVSFHQLIQKIVSAFFQLEALYMKMTIALSHDGRWHAYNISLHIDTAALFRHPELKHFQKKPLSYKQSLCHPQGTIACLANGEDIALATADLITILGGSIHSLFEIDQNNFYNSFKDALENIRHKPFQIKVLIINIFSGLMSCDVIAKNIQKSIDPIAKSITVIIRFEGTNTMRGCQLLQKTPNTFVTSSLQKAGKAAVDAARRDL